MAELPPNIASAFAAAALTPALRSVLVFDVSPLTLRAIASALAEALQAAGAREVEIIDLAVAQSEDDLWGAMALSPGPGPDTIVWRSGLLTRELESNTVVPLVLIPDLTQIGLLAQRACIALMDTPEATLERHGLQRRWASRICWLAACPHESAAMLSPHLLDRFALRLDGRALARIDRETTLRDLLVDPDAPLSELRLPSATVAQVLGALARPVPALDPGVPIAATELAPADTASGSLRRPLALVRLGAALARLEGDPVVTALHVLAASRLGRANPRAASTTAVPETAPPPHPESEQLKPTPRAEPQAAPAPTTHTADTAPPVPPVALVNAWVGDTPELLAQGLQLYPEDRPRRQATEPLRLPSRRFGANAESGPIIGVMPVDAPRDLALVATIIEAAKWQRYRRARRPDLAGHPLIVFPSDLRRHRRAPVVEQLLLLLIDYTCRAGYSWVAAIYPHILWAYRERAAVNLVQVGGADSSNELQAQALHVPNVLVPQLNQALNVGPGRATPLAHGLDLAAQALRRALQGGRSAVRTARLVVLSDGRGNVPLGLSRGGAQDGPVMRRGIDDALAAAAPLAALAHTERVLIAPEPRLYPEVAQSLAMALQAPLLLMGGVDATGREEAA